MTRSRCENINNTRSVPSDEPAPQYKTGASVGCKRRRMSAGERRVRPKGSSGWREHSSMCCERALWRAPPRHRRPAPRRQVVAAGGARQPAPVLLMDAVKTTKGRFFNAASPLPTAPFTQTQTHRLPFRCLRLSYALMET